MLKEVAGIEQIQKLYLQLLYRCNFNCQHCFHGERLRWNHTFSLNEVRCLLSMFCSEYGLVSVTLLGGEPFLYPHISEVITDAKERGLKVEICTNGYKIQAKLIQSAPAIDNLRVSLEGLEEVNDKIRRKGSFIAALESIRLARALDVYVSVTMTVNNLNIQQVMPLAHLLDDLGVRELKLHSLRIVGNVFQHEDLVLAGQESYAELHRSIAAESEQLKIAVLFDEDLDPHCRFLAKSKTITSELERIELQPSGELYISCKAVGKDCSAFFYNRSSGQILYHPHQEDELKMSIPQVRYSRI